MMNEHERPVKCPICDGHGALTMEEAIDLRGDSPNFMVDQEYLDDLIFAAGGTPIYTRRCPKDGHRCLSANEPVEKVRDRNRRYRESGLSTGYLCCRGEE